MDFLRYRHVLTILLLAALVGCTQQQNSQDLKEQVRDCGRRCSAAGGIAPQLRSGVPNLCITGYTCRTSPSRATIS